MNTVLRDTDYAREIATAQIPAGKGQDTYRLERLQRHDYPDGQHVIRFSWWKGFNIVPRPLDLSWPDLLVLIKRAITAGVLTDRELDQLRDMLVQRRDPCGVIGMTEGRENE